MAELLEPSQMAAFDWRGFIAFHSVIPALTVRRCRRHLAGTLWSPRHGRRPRSLWGVVTRPGVYKSERNRQFGLAGAPEGVRNRTWRLYGLTALPPPSPWRDLVFDPTILALVRELIRRPIRRITGLLFERGSQQSLHVDTWYGLGSDVPGGMVGVWFALDDVDDRNGPLLYVPGSHRTWPEVNYSQAASRVRRLTLKDLPVRDAAYSAAHRLLARAEAFRPRAGDVGIWHEQLLHGGSRIRDLNRTRMSVVAHYRF